MDWHELFSWGGRVSRRDYLITTLLVLGANVVALLVLAIFSQLLVGSGASAGGVSNFANLASTVLVVVTIVVSICNHIKRAHDLDWPGWTVLLLLIPFVNFVFFVLLVLLRGNPEPNRFGDPGAGSPFQSWG